jgi:signal transduction histidine kinase
MFAAWDAGVAIGRWIMTAIEFRPGSREWRSNRVWRTRPAPLAAVARTGWHTPLAVAGSAAVLLVLFRSADAGHLGWWVTAAAAVVLAMVSVAAGIGAAYRAGRAAERARWLRLVHDTALQSLEAMALSSDADRDSPAEILTQVRASARREAAALRGNLAELTGTERTRAGTLVGALTDVAAALPAGSPRVELVGGEPAPTLSAAGRNVLRDAARAALGNAVRHAAANRVVVRIAESGAGVAVVVRDDGRGFDPARTVPGFGIRQSITARIREAGGTATVESTPGRGTRVRLWVPAAVTTRRPRRPPRR